MRTERAIGRVTGFAVATILLGATGRAGAQGFLVIDRPPAPPPDVRRIPWSSYFPLEVKSLSSTCTIRETVGVTRIEQVFYNPNPQQMEGTYLCPLPDGASVQKFSMWMNGKEMHGELLDADKARQTYEDIVRKMRDPALLEYIGARTYRARVFPIPPRGDVRIALEYTETIRVDDGLAAYRLPLNTEKFSAKAVENVTVAVEIKSGAAIKSVFCPSHAATVSRPNDREARVGFEAHHVVPDRDFVLYWQMSDKEFGLSLISYRPIGEDGFFMARIAPSLEAPSKPMPKDVCFVVDTSGSMAGDKIAQARRALLFCVSSLREQDRFNVITFATGLRPFRDALVPASRENVEAAKAEIEKIEAAGGTNINEALLTALKSRPGGSEDRPYMIVFMTDGEPTIDERDPAKIQANVRDANKGASRLFVFGVGHDLNAKLLDRLAEDNRGAREYIDEKEDIEVKVSSFFRKVADPVLSHLVLRFGDADVLDVYPKNLPDLFHGSELVVVGRYRRAGKQRVVIEGKRAGESLTWKYPATFADGQTDAEFLPRLWATQRVGYLMDEIRLHGESGELKDAIVRLAKRYAIVTPYTSYLVLEDTAAPGIAQNRRTGGDALGRILNESRARGAIRPDEWSMGERFAESASGREGVRASRESMALKSATPAPSMIADTDADGAVAGTNGLHVGAGFGGYGRGYGYLARQSASTQPADAKPVIQVVGDKTFYRDGERWLDASYDGKAETRKIKAYSDEYFALLKNTPKLGKYLALGEKLVVVLGATAYEIVE